MLKGVNMVVCWRSMVAQV